MPGLLAMCHDRGCHLYNLLLENGIAQSLKEKQYKNLLTTLSLHFCVEPHSEPFLGMCGGG